MLPSAGPEVTTTVGAIRFTVTCRVAPAEARPGPSTARKAKVWAPSDNGVGGTNAQVAPAVPQPLQGTPAVEYAAPSMLPSTRTTTPSLSAAAPDHAGAGSVPADPSAGPRAMVRPGAVLAARVERKPPEEPLPAGSVTVPTSVTVTVAPPAGAEARVRNT